MLYFSSLNRKWFMHADWRNKVLFANVLKSTFELFSSYPHCALITYFFNCLYFDFLCYVHVWNSWSDANPKSEINGDAYSKYAIVHALCISFWFTRRNIFLYVQLELSLFVIPSKYLYVSKCIIFGKELCNYNRFK